MMTERRRLARRAGGPPARGFSLVELMAAIAILAVVFGLIIGVAGRVISANQVRLQESAFDILDGTLEDFAQQNALKFLRNLTGNQGVLPWKRIYGKYPPINLYDVGRPLTSNPRTDLDIAGRSLPDRIEGQYASQETRIVKDPPPLVDVGFPRRKVKVEVDNRDAGKDDYDDTESFLFYVNFYAPSLKARLERLPKGMLTNTDEDWVDVNGDGNGDPEDIELFELRDVWGNPVLYINDRRDRVSNQTGGTPSDGRIDNPLIEANNGKPVFVSPGPDGYFTAEDTPSDRMEPPPENPLTDNVYSIPRAVVDQIDAGTLSKLLHYDFSQNHWDPQ